MIRIRRAAATDVPVLMDMLGRLALDHQDRVTATPQFLATAIEMAGPQGLFLMAEVRGAPAAFAQYDYRTNYTHGDVSVNHTLLYTHPQFRRQGVGFALMQAVMRQGLQDGCVAYSISAKKNNAVALSAYDKYGMMKKDRGDNLQFMADRALMQKLVGSLQPSSSESQ